MNDKFGTTFSLFRHHEEHVSKPFAGMEAQGSKKCGGTIWESKVQRPSAVRERIKDEIECDLENPKRKKLIARAEAVYNRLTSPMRELAPKGSNDLCPETPQAEPRAPSECCSRMRGVSSNRRL